MSQENKEFSDRLRAASEMSKLAGPINNFLKQQKGQAPDLNRKQSRALGFDSAADMRKAHLREQAKQQVLEHGKGAKIAEWFDDQLESNLWEWLFRWVRVSKWRLRLFGFKLGVEEGFDLDKDLPTSTLRIWWMGRELDAICIVWEG